MPLQKYKKYYQLMVEQNKDLFDRFLLTHTAFVQNMTDQKVQHKFHQEGRDVLDVIRFWERKLCAGMERGTNGQYSSKVAEKFWNEVRKTYTHIDVVGVTSNSL
jgi:hypothetical protein